MDRSNHANFLSLRSGRIYVSLNSLVLFIYSESQHFCPHGFDVGTVGNLFQDLGRFNKIWDTPRKPGSVGRYIPQTDVIISFLRSLVRSIMRLNSILLQI